MCTEFVTEFEAVNVQHAQETAAYKRRFMRIHSEGEEKLQAQEGLLAEARVAHAAQVHQLREQHNVFVDEMKQALSSEFVAQTCVLEAKCRREVLDLQDRLACAREKASAINADAQLACSELRSERCVVREICTQATLLHEAATAKEAEDKAWCSWFAGIDLAEVAISRVAATVAAAEQGCLTRMAGMYPPPLLQMTCMYPPPHRP